MAKPSYPVVLVHGYIDVPIFSGTWEAAETILTEQGIPYFTPQIPPHGSIKERTAALIKQIQKKYPDGTVIHIFGHSMGGINARRIAFEADRNELGFKVKTVTTFGTPHRGVKAIDWSVGVDGGSDFATTLRSFLRSDFQAFGNLSDRFMKTFNEETPDVDSVTYFSWAGKVDMQTPVTSVCWGPTRIFGPTDGMVNIESAVWTQYKGTHLGTIHGIDHPNIAGRKAVTLTLPHIAAAEEGKTAPIVEIKDAVIEAMEHRVDSTLGTIGNVAKGPGRVLEKIFS